MPVGTSHFGAGEGGAQASTAGILSAQAGAVATAANTTETTLFTYTLLKGTMNAVNKGLRITGAFTTAANGNTKRFRLYLGTAVLIDTTAIAMNGLGGYITADLFRLATAATQDCCGTGQYGNVPVAVLATQPTQNLNADLVIKLTGQNGTGTASDCVGRQLLIEWLTEGGVA